MALEERNGGREARERIVGGWPFARPDDEQPKLQRCQAGERGEDPDEYETESSQHASAYHWSPGFLPAGRDERAAQLVQRDASQ